MCVAGFSFSFSTALVGRGSGTRQAASLSGLDSLRGLQAEAAWPSRRWRVANILALFFPLKAGLAPIEQKPNSSRRDKNTPNEFAKSNPGLGHAASRIRRGRPFREDKPAASKRLVHSPVIGLSDARYTSVHSGGLTIALNGREALALLKETSRPGKGRRLELWEDHRGVRRQSETRLHRGSIYPEELLQLAVPRSGAKRCMRICRHRLTKAQHGRAV